MQQQLNVAMRLTHSLLVLLLVLSPLDICAAFAPIQVRKQRTIMVPWGSQRQCCSSRLMSRRAVGTSTTRLRMADKKSRAEAQFESLLRQATGQHDSTYESPRGGSQAQEVATDPWTRLAQLENRVKAMEADVRATVAANAQLRASAARLRERNDALKAHLYGAQARTIGPRMSAAVGGPLSHDEETLQLGCTAAGALGGLAAGKVIGQVYLGGVAGAVAAALYAHRPDSRAGNFVRICGKAVIIGAYKIRALWQEFLVRWRAWNVYERLFKEWEALDRKFAVTERVGSLNDRYQIVDSVGAWASVVQAKAVEAGALVAGPVERVATGAGLAPHLEHLGSSIASSLQAVGRDIESNYNGTVSAWTGLTSDVASWTNGITASWFKWEPPSIPSLLCNDATFDALALVSTPLCARARARSVMQPPSQEAAVKADVVSEDVKQADLSPAEATKVAAAAAAAAAAMAASAPPRANGSGVDIAATQ
ncbi:hypothetical protein JKP88DRAFT_306175 [Tribonema minus]|uniref:Uncharacterized protein n=1 Tax=Tribonema minus TaxID=303371 RepID=A0A835ZD00_9STRA|nr:hypothetical protein JKP88DRAFT_306175 [Tribonema minus]